MSVSVDSPGSRSGAPSTREALLHRPERLLAFLLAAYAIVSAWDNVGRYSCIDYYQFWVVGRAVAAGETRDPYSDAERRRLGETYQQRAQSEALAAQAAAPAGASRRVQAARQRPVLETYSSPWLYTLAGVFSSGDYDRDVVRFQRASLLLYLAAIVLLARLLRFSPAAGALWVAALLQWFNPFVDDVIAGNVNRVQLFALALFLALPRLERLPLRRALAGLVLGSAVAMKPNLALVAVVWAAGVSIDRDWRKLASTGAGMLAGVLVSVAASAAWFGSLAPWRSWLAELPELAAAGSPVAGSAREGNYSLVRLVHDRAGVSIGGAAAAALLGLALFAAWRSRARSGTRPERDVVLVGLGAAIPLLAAELAWQHYFVMTIPLAMALLRPAGSAVPRPAPIAILGLVALAMISLQNVARLLGIQDASAGAAVVAGGTLLLFVLALLDAARARVSR